MQQCVPCGQGPRGTGQEAHEALNTDVLDFRLVENSPKARSQTSGCGALDRLLHFFEPQFLHP